MYKLGVDVGGTNTDAVLIDENLNVVGEIKHPTTGNIFEGIMGAVQGLLERTGVERGQIAQAMLGTTQCTNAIVERRNLAKIGLLRIGAPATLGVPPMADWAQDIRFIVEESTVISGGYEYDGKALNPLDEAAARAFFEDLKGRVESVAISCVFSTVCAEHELRAAQICRKPSSWRFAPARSARPWKSSRWRTCPWPIIRATPAASRSRQRVSSRADTRGAGSATYISIDSFARRHRTEAACGRFSLVFQALLTQSFGQQLRAQSPLPASMAVQMRAWAYSSPRMEVSR